MLDWVKKKFFLVRWGAVARNWSAKRFLATTDLDLSAEEQAQLHASMNGKRTIHGWRMLIPYYLKRFGGVHDGQFYCFGVAHGSTVHGLVTGFKNRQMKLPHLHLFDSFEGLPAEESGVAVPSVWTPGAFAAPQQTLMMRCEEYGVSKSSYTIHPGWFSKTLKSELVADGTFKPAAYIDIDCDLYNSTRDVLDFFFKHKLVRPGTLIGYDDWGDSDLWTAGESRAHKEILEKYGAACAQLFSWGEQPLIKKLFVVVSIAKPA